MDNLKEKSSGNNEPGASPGAEGWKDVLQFVKEQSEKLKKLARALSVIQQGMLKNNPGHVKDSLNEATEVLGGMFNTHRCHLESGVEIQKILESHPVTKKMGIFRTPRSASLGDTPKSQTKREKKRRMKTKHSTPARSGDAIKVSARDGQSWCL